ncbi:sensor domain-containing phosphodiesterase [Alteriqipengyuania sp. 357]
MTKNLAVAIPDDTQPLRFEAIENDSIKRILKAARQHLDAEIAFVGRYVDDDQRELMHVDTELELPMGAGFREPCKDSFCWHILEGRLPELIHDAQEIPFARELPITDMLPVGMHLNVPLRLSDGSVFGSFCCVSRDADRSITQRDMDVLRAFGQLAAEQIESTLARDEQRLVTQRMVENVIAERSLSIVLQPIHDLHAKSVAGFECLARFDCATGRTPADWFHQAKSVQLGTDLEMLALETALAEAAKMPGDLYISINASPEAIMSGRVARALEEAGNARIVLEVTEHEQVGDFAKLAAALKEIRPYAKIAIDDVGAGYAGLRYLVDLAPDLLKLDMSLTTNIDIDPARQALASAIVHFANAIGSDVVAEGIERAEELESLCDLGVRYGQGYHFAKPMPFVRANQYLLTSNV